MNYWTVVTFCIGVACGRFVNAWGRREPGFGWWAKTPWEWHWRFALLPTHINYGEPFGHTHERWIWMRGYYSRLNKGCSKSWLMHKYYERAMMPLVDPILERDYD